MSRLLQPEEVEKFKGLLKGYVLHEEVLEMYKKSNFAIIAGPAGAGKDTLRNELIRQYPDQYVPILSTTTRPPREGEVQDLTYHFKEIEEFEDDLHEQQFFMAELVHDQQVSGLDIAEIHKLESGQWGLSILITKAEQKLVKIKPDIKTLFLVPPSVELLMSRMQSERVLNDAELSRRLHAASLEIEDALTAEHYYCLISDTVENVVERSHRFLQGDYADPAYNQQARTAARQILDNLRNW